MRPSSCGLAAMESNNRMLCGTGRIVEANIDLCGERDGIGRAILRAAQRLGVKVTLTLGRLRETARHSKPETHETAAARRRGRSATTRRLLLHCRVALESQFDVVPQPP